MGDIQYTDGCSVHREDIMSTSGDTQYIGGFRDPCEGGHICSSGSVPQQAEEHAKSRHFLISLNATQFLKIVLEPPEYPRIGKCFICKHL